MSVIKPTLCVGCCLRSISSLSLTVLTWQLVLLAHLVQHLNVFILSILVLLNFSLDLMSHDDCLQSSCHQNLSLSS